MAKLTVISKKFAAENDVTYILPGGEFTNEERLKDLELLAQGPVTMGITPATKADILAGVKATATVYQVEMTLLVGTEILGLGNYTLAAAIADTTTPTATISDETPTMVNGVAVVNVTLPAGTYAENETVTVTISNLTLPDGRTVTGGTSVLTIAAA